MLGPKHFLFLVHFVSYSRATEKFRLVYQKVSEASTASDKPNTDVVVLGLAAELKVFSDIAVAVVNECEMLKIDYLKAEEVVVKATREIENAEEQYRVSRKRQISTSTAIASIDKMMNLHESSVGSFSGSIS